MKTKGQRIQALRKALKLTQEEFAGRLSASMSRGESLTRGAVGNWERDEGIKQANLELIALTFDSNYEWLATGRGTMFLESQPRHAKSKPFERVKFAGQLSSRGQDYITIPEHDVRASAGPGTIVEDETEVAAWPLPHDYVRHVLSLRSANLAMIEVIGDSMEPTLRSGDKIMIDLNDKNIAQLGVFALFDGDATVVKRVEKVMGTDKIRLSSDNRHHREYEVPVETVNIAGRVVWFGRRL